MLPLLASMMLPTTDVSFYGSLKFKFCSVWQDITCASCAFDDEDWKDNVATTTTKNSSNNSNPNLPPLPPQKSSQDDGKMWSSQIHAQTVQVPNLQLWIEGKDNRSLVNGRCSWRKLHSNLEHRSHPLTPSHVHWNSHSFANQSRFHQPSGYAICSATFENLELCPSPCLWFLSTNRYTKWWVDTANSK